MADELKVYALDDGSNKRQTMTKEQIIAAIIQAVNEGTIKNIDAGFISNIKELNKQNTFSFWIGTQAEFLALNEKRNDLIYLFTDDPFVNDVNEEIAQLQSSVDDLDTKIDDEITNLSGELKNGTIVVDTAKRSSISLPVAYKLYSDFYIVNNSVKNSVELSFSKDYLENNATTYSAFKLVLVLSASAVVTQASGTVNIDLGEFKTYEIPVFISDNPNNNDANSIKLGKVDKRTYTANIHNTSGVYSDSTQGQGHIHCVDINMSLSISKELIGDTIRVKINVDGVNALDIDHVVATGTANGRVSSTDTYVISDKVKVRLDSIELFKLGESLS